MKNTPIIKKWYLYHAFLFSILLCFLSLTPPPAHAEKANVAYGGLWTAGKQDNFPVFSRIQKKYPPDNPKNLGRVALIALQKINENLSFNILFETDTEQRKREFDHPFSLALAITRDDIAFETYKTPVADIYKTIANAGIVLIIYQTVKDEPNQYRNTIVYSVPLVGYSVHNSEKPLTEDEQDELFINTAKKTIEEHLVKRLNKISIGTITGNIKTTGDLVIIDRGLTSGLDMGQKITFIDKDGNDAGKGTIRDISRNESKVKPDGNFRPTQDMSWYTRFIKGLTDETYQVVDFKITSKKAQQIFKEKELGSQVSQWFSDFLVDKAGKAVLPSKISGEWIDDRATGESFAILVKDEKEYKFSVAKPKYPIMLDLTGLNSKMVEGNNVNEIWAYKAWLKVDVPDKNISVKYDEVSSVNIVPGIQQTIDKFEFFDLIHKLTHKAVKEGNI